MTLFEGSLAPKPQRNRLGCQFDQMSACITLPDNVSESSLTLRTVSKLGFTLLTHSIDEPLLRPSLGGVDVSCLELDKTPVHVTSQIESVLLPTFVISPCLPRHDSISPSPSTRICRAERLLTQPTAVMYSQNYLGVLSAHH